MRIITLSIAPFCSLLTKASQPRTQWNCVHLSRAGQTLVEKSVVLNIPSKDQLNGGTINVTYDLVNDPDLCEHDFLFCTLPFGVASGNRFTFPVIYLYDQLTDLPSRHKHVVMERLSHVESGSPLQIEGTCSESGQPVAYNWTTWCSVPEPGRLLRPLECLPQT